MLHYMMDPTAPHHSSKLSHAAGRDSKMKQDIPAVRFAVATEEISPSDLASDDKQDGDYTFSETETETETDQLKAFTKSLHGRPLQARRMNTFQFEAFSLPPSRVSWLGHHCLHSSPALLYLAPRAFKSPDISVNQGPISGRSVPRVHQTSNAQLFRLSVPSWQPKALCSDLTASDSRRIRSVCVGRKEDVQREPG